jgi:hypothetical protein
VLESFRFACPTKSILDHLPAVKPYIKALPPEADGIALSANRELFPQSVKEDLARIRRQQRFQRLESKWIPIPSFSFSTPATTIRDKKGIDKFIFGMLEIFALGVSEVVPRQLQELEFVSLCSLKREVWVPEILSR